MRRRLVCSLRVTFLATSLLTLTVSACAGKRLETPDVVDDSLAYATTDRAKAAALLDAALGDTRDDDERLVIELHAAEQRRLLGEGDKAREAFTALGGRVEKGPVHDAARLGIALVDAAAAHTPTTLSILRNTSDKSALPSQNADRYLHLALDAVRRDDARAAADYAREAVSWSHEFPDIAARVQRDLGTLIEPRSSGLRAPKRDLTPLEEAELAVTEGRPDQARSVAQQILDTVPADAHDALVARYLIRRLDAPPVNPNAIGVLLPMSGKFEAVGRQIKAALEYGYGRTGTPRRLVFADTGETTESALAALERLVFDKGVIAVVGPLRRDIADPLMNAADAMRVPILGLSQANAVTDDRDWAFQLVPTPREQCQALLDYVMTRRSMQSFAIFAPDTPYGHDAADAFRKVAGEKGATITVEEFYDDEAPDLIPYAQKLGRKDYEARADEFRELKKDTKEKGGNPDKVVLPPILDFDGLFLPDSAQRIPVALAGLAYEEFPLGEFQISKDGPTIPVLGLSAWNHPSLVVRGGPYARGSLFTDAFFADDDTSRSFVDRFHTNLGHTPKSLEALAVNAGQVLATIAATDAHTRPALRDALLAVHRDDAITGGSFRDDRVLDHRMRILSLDATKIYAVDAPPEPTEPTEPANP